MNLFFKEAIQNFLIFKVIENDARRIDPARNSDQLK